MFSPLKSSHEMSIKFGIPVHWFLTVSNPSEQFILRSVMLCLLRAITISYSPLKSPLISGALIVPGISDTGRTNGSKLTDRSEITALAYCRTPTARRAIPIKRPMVFKVLFAIRSPIALLSPKKRAPPTLCGTRSFSNKQTVELSRRLLWLLRRWSSRR